MSKASLFLLILTLDVQDPSYRFQIPSVVVKKQQIRNQTIAHRSLLLRRPNPGTPPLRTRSHALPPREIEEIQPQRRSHIHKPHRSPLNAIPRKHVPVNPPPHRIHAVKMPHIRDQQTEQHRTPHPHILRRPQHQRFVDSQVEIQVGELRHHDGGGDGDAMLGGTGRMGQV